MSTSLSWLSNDHDRALFIGLLLELADSHVTCIYSRPLIDRLMPHYKASLCQADRYQLDYLLRYERSDKEEPMLTYALQWSPHPNTSRVVTPLLLTNNRSQLTSAVLSFLSDIDRERMWHSIINYPITRSMANVAPIASDTDKKDLSLYDPAYFLPVFCFFASLGDVVPTRLWVETHALSLAITSLASTDDHIRRIAFVLLDQLLPLLQAATDWKERRQVLWLLVSLKSSITQRDPLPSRLPMIIVHFAVHTLKLALTPRHFMYPLVNGFLLQRPIIDLEDVPMLYSLFHAATPDAKRRKRWMLHLLVHGLTDASDYPLYRRRHVIDLCLSYASSSSLCDEVDVELVLELLSRATDIDGVLEEVVMQHGVLAWIQAAFSFEVISSSPRHTQLLAGLANRICRRLCLRSKSQINWTLRHQIQNIMTTLVTRTNVLSIACMTIETLLQTAASDLDIFTATHAQSLEQLLNRYSSVKATFDTSDSHLSTWAYPDQDWHTQHLYNRCVIGLFELLFYPHKNGDLSNSDSDNGNNIKSDCFTDMRENVTFLALVQRIEPAVSWLRWAKQV
ncbi:hypothetical protein BDF19DRAFT_322505 [Syncephalis fuscata]|nr:hypothetical protein BDF19DRAFT_322505 [Syncephalis fuscata]